MTQVDIGVGTKPGILISGHDLKDMEELLEQTQGTGVDVYTHGEMLPANYYPAFKKYENFHGNYGGSWWKQGEEFTSFNGPILMTTNCITPVKDAYKDRIYTTNTVGYPGVTHLADRSEDGKKDFSVLIEQAKTCAAPVEIETGTITGGFAHHQVMALADKVVDAVKTGAIKRFVVMAGCDGRHKTRDYFTDVAETLPQDTVILTAGCAKYRYNKLDLGDIGGIPRVLDAGQCNDSYSLAVIAMKLQEVFGLEETTCRSPTTSPGMNRKPSSCCSRCSSSASKASASARLCRPSYRPPSPKCSSKTSTSSPSVKSKPMSPP
jgi:hydroxylamine reductase